MKNESKGIKNLKISSTGMRTQVLAILIEDERIWDPVEGTPSFYRD